MASQDERELGMSEEIRDLVMDSSIRRYRYGDSNPGFRHEKPAS
jgi:hypothetical protein